MKELISIQTNLKAPKNQWNDFGKYKYRNAESILEAVKPLLQQTECTLVISDEIIAVNDRIYVKATAIIKNKEGESEQATAFAREPLQKKGQDESQVTGAASSYARKYALNGLFAIDDTKDADTLNNNPQYTQQPQQQSQQGGGLSPREILTGYALPAIEQAQTREELARIWNDYAMLQGDGDFLTALTSRRKALGIKKSNEK